MSAPSPELTTLCYIEQGDKYLMLHRTKKKNDPNHDLWLGLGGHFEEGESPDECVVREVLEESGLTLMDQRLRGVVTFSDGDWVEYMFLYSASQYEGNISDCNEGELVWVEKQRVLTELPIWEGDRIFLRLMSEDRPFFSLKLTYEHRRLIYAALDGKELTEKSQQI